jgi:hypothetical protein
VSNANAARFFFAIQALTSTTEEGESDQTSRTFSVPTIQHRFEPNVAPTSNAS